MLKNKSWFSSASNSIINSQASREESPPLLDGFSTLFLNRVNYSGVLFAGPLGGTSLRAVMRTMKHPIF